ncbi:MAG: hypothetical protein ACLP50_33965 [Solirubrobacteraceae bacterium]
MRDPALRPQALYVASFRLWSGAPRRRIEAAPRDDPDLRDSPQRGRLREGDESDRAHGYDER